ncbi:U3 small nucleolar RNA-associated protein [Tilletia horrida]|nr:U3 small nucleolar RNA-associated protein [Tilletia horrida]KAK0568460.1 U3 small nucleolar RNA-associated protein [Tilletia horrida]
MDLSLSADLSFDRGSASTAADSLVLHRVRFLDWQPSPITAIAFAPLPPHLHASTVRPILAIARQNGNIELCQWNHTESERGSGRRLHAPVPRPWLVDSVIVNPSPANVQSLCFVLGSVESNPNTLRLFSISGGALLTEHALPPSIAAIYHRHAKSSPYSSSTARNPFTSTTSAASSTSRSSDPRFLTASRSLPSHAGTIWSISPSPLGTKLALGCEDGRVRLIDIAQGRFQHLDQSSPLARRRRPDGTFRGIAPTLDRAKGRLTCLAWGPPQRTASFQQVRKGVREAGATDSDSSSDDDDGDEDEDSGEVSGWTESFLVGGTSSSHAVLWDVTTGQTLARLQTPTARSRSRLDGPEIVWSCAVLPDGTIVLGDSSGRVTFYDGKTRVPIPGASFASHGQNADVLALCVGPDGKTLYSGSVDQRVAEYTLINTSALANSGSAASAAPSLTRTGKWVQTGLKRLHAHDIRALAIEPAFDMMHATKARHDALARQGDRTAPLVNRDELLPPRLPILASGGLDFHLVLTPAAPPTSLQARDENGRNASGSDEQEDDAAHLSRSPSKRHIKGSHRSQGRAADGLDSTRIAETAHAVNPISTTTLVNFADTTQRRVPFVPHNSLGAGAQGSLGSLLAGGSVAAVLKRKRWLLLRRERSIAIWRLGTSGGEAALEEDEIMGGVSVGDGNVSGMDRQNWTKLLDLQPKLRSQIVAAAIDPTGRFLAISDLFETKLFSLGVDAGEDDEGSDDDQLLVPAKVATFSKAFDGLASAPSSSALAFSPSGNTLVLCTHRGAWVHVVTIQSRGAEEQTRCAVVKSFAQHRSRPTWLDAERAIPSRAIAGRKVSAMNGLDTADNSSVDEHAESFPNGGSPNGRITATIAPLRDQFVNVLHATISDDGCFLATLDDSRRAHIFSLEKLSHVRVMPSLPERPASLTWRTFGEASNRRRWLVALLPGGEVTAWDVAEGPVPEALQEETSRWSRSISSALVPVLSSIKDPAVGMLWLPSRGSSSHADQTQNPSQSSSKRRKKRGKKPTDNILVWGPNWLCTVASRRGGASKQPQKHLMNGGGDDVEMEDASVPNGTASTPNGSQLKRRRRGSHSRADGLPASDKANGGSHGSSSAGDDFETRLNFRYASLLLVDTVYPVEGDEAKEEEEADQGQVELVVVERPFFDLVPHMAPAYNRGAKYGS